MSHFKTTKLKREKAKSHAHKNRVKMGGLELLIRIKQIHKKNRTLGIDYIILANRKEFKDPWNWQVQKIENNLVVRCQCHGCIICWKTWHKPVGYERRETKPIYSEIGARYQLYKVTMKFIRKELVSTGKERQLRISDEVSRIGKQVRTESRFIGKKA